PGGTPWVSKGAGFDTARQWLSSNRMVKGKAMVVGFDAEPYPKGKRAAPSRDRPEVFYSAARPVMLTLAGARRQEDSFSLGRAPMLRAAESPWTEPLLMLLAVRVLVALNGLFVAAEFALVAIRKTRVEEMVQLGVAGARKVEKALARLDRSIAATQLGITLASIGLGWVGEPALAQLLLPLFRFLPDAGSGVAAHSVATGLAFILITFMHVVF